MIAFRLLVLFCALATAACVVGYFIGGDRKYLRWAGRVIKYTATAALIFFAVLILERI